MRCHLQHILGQPSHPFKPRDHMAKGATHELSTSSKRPSPRMSWFVLLLISAVDLAAVFFNVRLIRICFKDKSKYEFLEKCRLLAICQGASQVIILVADSVEWWNGLTILLGETCSFFRVLCLSVNFYQTCNLTAMMTVYYEHPEGNQKQLPFPKVRIFAALCLGFVGSAMILWHNCFSHALISEVIFKLAFFVTVSLVLFLFAVTPTKASKNLEIDSTESQSATDNCLSPWKVWKENKMPMFFTMLFLACLILILSGAPHSESLLYEDLEEVAIFKEVMFSAITKFAVGIVLPVTLHDLINSSYMGNKLKTVTAYVL